jgi:hypothetical protein
MKKHSHLEVRRKTLEKNINDENYKMMLRIIKQSPSVSLKD